MTLPDECIERLGAKSFGKRQHKGSYIFRFAVQIYNFFFRIIKKCITFALGLGSRQIKRECRANRQQTRCCEFHHNVSFAEDHSTDFILPKNREGIQEKTETSQKTCLRLYIFNLSLEGKGFYRCFMIEKICVSEVFCMYCLVQRHTGVAYECASVVGVRCCGSTM